MLRRRFRFGLFEGGRIKRELDLAEMLEDEGLGSVFSKRFAVCIHTC